jgi:hypothetical protein
MEHIQSITKFLAQERNTLGQKHRGQGARDPNDGLSKEPSEFMLLVSAPYFTTVGFVV